MCRYEEGLSVRKTLLCRLNFGELFAQSLLWIGDKRKGKGPLWLAPRSSESLLVPSQT